MIQPFHTKQLQPAIPENPAHKSQLFAESVQLEKVTAGGMGAANLVMMGSGYFSPIQHTMDQAESLQVASDMRCNDGMFWPIPITNLVKESPSTDARRVALLDPNAFEPTVLAIQDIENIEHVSEEFLRQVAQGIFGTDSNEHPGVARLFDQGRYLLSGPVTVLHNSYYPVDFPNTFMKAGEIRRKIEKRQWRKVVAFQTRNPMHRAHEELCKMALDDLNADGLVIHMLLGKLKQGDIPASVRDESIRVMVKKYFPANSVLVCGYGFDMMYAGPREALLHAIFRQNMGADALIVGRDHAGVGKWYEPFAAQEIFDSVPEGALDIEIYKADHTAWSKKLNRIVMMRDVPDHTPEDYIFLSGTKVRETLARGEPLPREFSRPEVAQVLGEYYRSQS